MRYFLAFFLLASPALIGGLLNRWRGGWLPGPGNTVRRLILAAATTAWMLTLLRPEIGREAVLLALSFWALSFAGWVPGWGKWMDMGHMGHTVRHDLIGMTLRGLVVTGPAGAALAYWHLQAGLIYAASGLAMGAIYLASWAFYDHTPVRWRGFGGTVGGEFLFGTWIWGALYVGLAA